MSVTKNEFTFEDSQNLRNSYLGGMSVGLSSLGSPIDTPEKKCTQCSNFHTTKFKLCESCRNYHSEAMKRKRAVKKLISNPILNGCTNSTPKSTDIMPVIAACYSNIFDGTIHLSGTYQGRDITCTIDIKPRTT